MIDRNELPSQKGERRTAEQAELEEKRKQAEEHLRGAMSRVFATEDGLIVLGWLRRQCLFGESILGANPASGEIDPQRTLYQAMRLNLYISIRRFLSPNILKEVEYEDFA